MESNNSMGIFFWKVDSDCCPYISTFLPPTLLLYFITAGGKNTFPRFTPRLEWCMGMGKKLWHSCRRRPQNTQHFVAVIGIHLISLVLYLISNIHLISYVIPWQDIEAARRGGKWGKCGKTVNSFVALSLFGEDFVFLVFLQWFTLSPPPWYMARIAKGNDLKSLYAFVITGY